MTKVPDKKPKVELMPNYPDMQNLLDLPQKPEDFLKSIPDDRETCVLMIQKNMLYLTNQTTLRYWFIGRVISSMEEHGEEKVVEELEQRLNCRLRMLQYIRAIYLKFPNFSSVEKACSCGLEWTDFKLLSSIKDAEKREETLQKLIEGKLDRKSIPDEVERLSPKPKNESSEETPPEEKTVTDKKPVAFFQTLEKRVVNFQEEISDLLAEYSQMLDIVQNEELVSEDEYATITASVAETLNNIRPLVKILSDLYKDSIDKFELKVPSLKD